MGAWGAGVFENDDAMDFLHELVEVDSFKALREFLDPIEEAHPGEYLEALPCAVALAAAEVIAAGAGRPADPLPDQIASWLETRSKRPSSKLMALARRCVQRIQTDSELQELWDEDKDADRWWSVLDNLEERLVE